MGPTLFKVAIISTKMISHDIFLYSGYFIIKDKTRKIVGVEKFQMQLLQVLYQG